MKENIRRIGSIVFNLVNPFGVTVISARRGTNIRFRDLANPQLVSPTEYMNPKQVRVDTGGTARIVFDREGKYYRFLVKDFRTRPGHTPGASITSLDKGGLKLNLDPTDPEQKVDGVGKFVYYKGKRKF